MKTLIEFNAALFLLSCAILFWVLRYRVHLHVEYKPRTRRYARRQVSTVPPSVGAGKREAGGNSGEVPPATRQDLESALVHLGASKKEAKARTASAIAQGPAKFDTLLFRAMQAGS